MKKHLLLLSLLVLMSVAGLGDARVPKVIQDPKTKVVYYLESDRRHITAISPAGKLLWCCEVFTGRDMFKSYVVDFGFYKPGDHLPAGANREDYLSVVTGEGGEGSGWINKRTGVFTDSGIVD